MAVAVAGSGTGNARLAFRPFLAGGLAVVLGVAECGAKSRPGDQRAGADRKRDEECPQREKKSCMENGRFEK